MIDKRFPNWDVDIEKGTVYSLYYKKYIGVIGINGYVKVHPPKGYKHKSVHQYIWMVANQAEIPEGYDIHHIDGNRSNNSINNLELIEQSTHRSEHNKGNINWLGKKHTEETKKKISEYNKGKKHTEETKKKIGEKNSKKVVQYTIDGELVKIWGSIAECSNNGFNGTNIVNCCKGKPHYHTHKGFIWEYYEEQKDVA